MVIEPSSKKPKENHLQQKVFKTLSFLLNNITFYLDFHSTNFGTTGSKKEEKGGITPQRASPTPTKS